MVSRERSKGAESPLTLLPTLLLVQPRVQLAFWAASAHCRVMALGLERKKDVEVTNSCVFQGVFSILSCPMRPPCLLPRQAALGRLKLYDAQ